MSCSDAIALFMAECHAYGLRHVGIAPGSRNTRLVEAAVQHGGFKIQTHIDERSLAFWALGVSKITGKAPIVITTSGSAIANLFPAMVEASESELPLLFLTADRSKAEQQCGSNQTIRSQQLPLDYCRAFLEWDLCQPRPWDSSFQASLTTLFDTAHADWSGPVQVNCLLPDPSASSVNSTPSPASFISSPLPHHAVSKSCKSDKDWKAACSTIQAASSGLIVCAAMSEEDANAWVKSLQKGKRYLKDVY